MDQQPQSPQSTKTSHHQPKSTKIDQSGPKSTNSVRSDRQNVSEHFIDGEVIIHSWDAN